MIVLLKSFVPKGFSGITLYPFIIIREKSLRNNAIFINHEKIHLAQQLELLIVFFYLWYSIEYLFLLIKYKKHQKAYRSISFEKEAYRFQSDLNYLKKRKVFGFFKLPDLE